MLILILVIFFMISRFSGDENGNGGEEKEATTTDERGGLGREGTLPGEAEESATTTVEDLDGVEAEKLQFGQFYEKRSPFSPEEEPETYDLPMNIKTDVANYHDVARKIDLEGEVEELNTTGFTVIRNPFEEEADDFYEMYRHLTEKEVPPLLTTDFLIYYYQNILKDSFKEIEHNIFYDNLWEINRSLYHTAKRTYEERREEVGMVNDPLLEAARMETAFFAVTLKLLEPTEEQTAEEKKGLSEESKFTKQEASTYSLELPDYLKSQVEEEVELIRKGRREEESSPVMLYKRNYREDFQVPDEYEDTARLNNFYLASEWLNSNFPLYHRDEGDCSECLLDKEDWRISTIASFLISKHFDESQALKNKWARIYKIISFFEGLREDLTYLDYNESWEELIDEEKGVEEVFPSYGEEMDDRLEELREDLEDREFSDMAGGYNTDTTSTRPLRGLKVLTESYWPNDHIFERLTFPFVTFYRGGGTDRDNEDLNITSCELGSGGSKGLYRCRGVGMDVVDLVKPLPEENEYFAENTNYNKYNERKEELREELKKFDNYKWHSENFWSLLDMSRTYIQEGDIQKPAFTRSDEWRNKKIRTSLGAWANLQLEKDSLKIYKGGDSEGGLGRGGVPVSEYAYVEPEPELIAELISNSEMLQGMLDSLKITDEVLAIKTDMERMIERLKRTEEIAEKELSGEELSGDDHEFLHEFIRRYEVDSKGKKEMGIDFGEDQGRLMVNIEEVDVAVVTYEKEGKKFFAVGPVFGYREWARN